MHDAEAYISTAPCLKVCADRSRSRELEDVVSRRMPSFYRTAYRLLGNVADAEDAVQDALLSAYKHLRQFRRQSQMSTWLTAIVSNCARMQLRRRPRQIHMSLDEPMMEEQEHSMAERLADRRPTPEDECHEAELNSRLREWTAQLSPALRRTFQLRELQGLSVYETADILQVPEGTVKAQMSRARAKLARSLRRSTPPGRRARIAKS